VNLTGRVRPGYRASCRYCPRRCPAPSVQSALRRRKQRLIQVGRRLGGVLAALRDITGALFLGQVVHLPGNDGLQTELLLLLGEFAAISPFPQLHSRLQALVDLGGNIAQHLNEGIHGISGSEIGERRATARHPGNTAIVHFFAGRDVPGSAWEEPERDEHQLVQGAAHPRHAIRTRPAFIRTRGGCSYPDSAPVGAPPSVRSGPAHIRTRGGCSYSAPRIRCIPPAMTPQMQPTTNPPTWAALAIAPKPNTLMIPDKQNTSQASIMITTPLGRSKCMFGASSWYSQQ